VIYLTAEDILRRNERFVGPGGLMDPGLLESAVARPQMTLGDADAYPTVHDKAAALFHSLTCNHCFVNGNKRTAVVAAGTFLKLNSYKLVLPWQELVSLATDTAERRCSVSDIARTLDEGTLQISQAASLQAVGSVV
jgi:death-on-curing protein